MTALFYFLCLFAFLGSVDIGYFHIYRYRLCRVPASRGEQITHLLRSLLFLATLFWVMHVDGRGPASLALPGLLRADLVNSMIDVLLEPASRQELGGLPPLEYAVHMLTMFLSGAILTLAVLDTLGRVHQAPALQLGRLGVPRLWLAVGWQILIGTAGFCLFEAAGFLRACLRSPAAPEGRR